MSQMTTTITRATTTDVPAVSTVEELETTLEGLDDDSSTLKDMGRDYLARMH